ncbi:MULTISPECIES: YybH family protein [unclassified Nostoc]|uniref:YybH family protein n=1 Tax=unclassified Nostoc TaxID=2593658 RepID=UPI002AD2A7D0|nr:MULTISPECIES: nuclear transport factor 2 family protein [unclassified Nostoc]MDZ8122817.1 nuclear transport factor 2 family protein [Nostoc sp. CmiVER01]MDZ8226189.1 nuclear transport factor 2 family protein [Nostoc sp. ChiVER01]
MKETLEEAKIKERVNDWLAAFSPGNKPFDFSVLDNLYWQDEKFLAFDTLSPQTTRIQGWQSYEEVWKPFMVAIAQWQVKPVGDIRIWTNDNIAVSALIFRSTATTIAKEAVVITAHATLVWENRQGQWRIIHEHISNPVNIDTN